MKFTGPDHNHLHQARELRFDDIAAMTDADHFSIIEQGVSTALYAEGRKAARDYAKEYIADPELQTEALLYIAEVTVQGMKAEAGGYVYSRRGDYTQENRQRYDEAAKIVKNIVKSEKLSTADITLRTLRLSRDLVDRQITYVVLDDDGRARRLYTDAFTSEEGRAQLKSTKELAAVSATCIDTLRYKFPQDISSLNEPVHKSYINLLSTDVADTKVGDRIIESALESIYTSSPDAVADTLSLLDKTESVGLKRSILNKAHALTVASSQEPFTWRTVEETPKKRFRLKPNSVILVDTEYASAFESRLGLLDDAIGQSSVAEDANKRLDEFRKTSRLNQILNLYPDFVKRVVELHDEHEQTHMWQHFVEQLGGLHFSDDTYRLGALEEIKVTQEKFSKIAPAEHLTALKRLSQEKLASSSPRSTVY